MRLCSVRTGSAIYRQTIVLRIFLSLLPTQWAINEACTFKCGRDTASYGKRVRVPLQKCCPPFHTSHTRCTDETMTLATFSRWLVISNTLHRSAMQVKIEICVCVVKVVYLWPREYGSADGAMVCDKILCLTMLCQCYGEHCLGRAMILRWHAKFTADLEQ